MMKTNILRHMVLLALFVCLCSACNSSKNRVVSEELPPIYPEYAEVTIPPNIAPLNFLLRNKPSDVEVSLKGASSNLLVRANDKVQFPEGRWRRLLEAEKGGRITVQVTACVDDEWIQYAPFYWYVTEEKVDPYLSYRLIEPGYEVWNAIQLRERNVESFNERVIADNNLTDNACMNCHIYGNRDPKLSLFHLRGEKGGTILNRNGELRKLNTRTGNMPSSLAYGDIHPSGRYGVFSSNTVVPSFHTLGNERLEVYDEESDIYVLDFDKNKLLPLPRTTDASRTFPVFSADGKAVYYCEAPFEKLPEDIRKVRYNLLRVGFDVASGSFDNRVDTLFSAEENNQSVSFPKASPDGQYILYTVSDYGTFPIWHQEADLQLLNLWTGEKDSLSQVNAFRSDTYHSWSSDSRWFVFASKRDDGMYGKPYFCYIDREGKAGKPFVLPQKDPAFYDYTFKSFNIPELSTGKLPFDAKDIERIYQNVEAEQL